MRRAFQIPPRRGLPPRAGHGQETALPRSLLCAALLGTALGLVAPIPSALAGPERATLIRVVDGDTLRVQSRGQLVSVRLACIDAPETSQSPQGEQARLALQQLLPAGSAVELRVSATDRYGRSIAEVSRSGEIINQTLVAGGQAFVAWMYIRGCDRQTYGRLETLARLKGLGVWAVPGGILRPWDHRRAARSGSR